MSRKNVRPVSTLWPDHLRSSEQPGGHDADGLRSDVSGFRRSPLWDGNARLDGGVQPTDRAFEDSGTLSGRRHDASRTRNADGGHIRPHGRSQPDIGLRFDTQVPPGGYAWWYVDAISDDGVHAITMIAFVGSVFSPYYAWSGRKNPENFCAMNVALYGGGKSRWAMTERSSDKVSRSANHFQVGPSQITKEQDHLAIDICETGAPLPYPVRGRVRIYPEVMTDKAIRLDSDGYHMWWPVAPRGRIEVEFEKPHLNWQGTSYVDTNAGVVPLEASFKRWDWCRASLDDGIAVLYDVEGREGHRESLALWIDESGEVKDFLPPRPQALPTTFWRVERNTQVDDGQVARVVETLEDSPFYARSIIETSLLQKRCKAMHESLSLERFSQPIVKAMLPFRMPRTFWP